MGALFDTVDHGVKSTLGTGISVSCIGLINLLYERSSTEYTRSPEEVAKDMPSRD